MAKAATDVDLFRTGPGTLAGRYLRSFWQPVYRLQDLPARRAVPILIMSEDLALYRGEDGQPHLAAAPRDYPTQEYLGLIFAYFGEGEPPPLRRYPDFDEPGALDVYPPEYWPCNYFNRIDNAADGAHLAFAHRESRQATGVLRPLPELNAEETTYGVRTIMSSPKKPDALLHFHMPNVNLFFQAELKLRDPLAPAGMTVGRLLFRVPVDDQSCVSFPIDQVPLTGSAGQEYLKRRRVVEDAQVEPERDPVRLSELVLAGKLTLADVLRRDPGNPKTLTSAEDYVVQVGQGNPWDRTEHLGKMDVGVILIRQLWRRELLALSEGRAIRAWASERLGSQAAGSVQGMPSRSSSAS